MQTFASEFGNPVRKKCYEAGAVPATVITATVFAKYHF